MLKNSIRNLNCRLGILVIVFACLLLTEPVYASDIVESGIQGTVKWELDDTNTLYVAPIEETGEMDVFTEDSSDAWKAHKEQIQTVVIDEGVKNISANAFRGCTNLSDVTIPKSVEYVHVSSFLETKYLEDLIATQKDGNVVDDNVLLYYDEETKPLGYTVFFSRIRVVAEDIFVDCDVTPVKSLSVGEEVEVIGYLGITPQSVRFYGYKRQWDNIKKSEKDDFSTAKLTVEKIETPVLRGEDSEAEVTLEWEPIYGAEVYRIYRSKNSNSSVLIKEITDMNVTSFVDENVQNGVYRYDISVNGYGKYAGSNYVKIVRMTNASVSVKNDTHEIKLSWKPITPSTGYYVERKEADGEWKQISEISDGMEKAYVDRDVMSGKTYSYRIQAFYGELIGPYSNEVTITRLDYPMIINCDNLANGIKISWKKISGAQGYYVSKKVSGGSWKPLTTIKNGNTVSYIDKDVVAGKIYNYKVEAYAGEYLSQVAYHAHPNSSAKGIRRIECPVITVTNTSTGVSIKWKKVSYGEGYYVERKVPNGEWKKIAFIKNVNTVSYLDKGVKNGKTYNYRVRTLHFTYSTAKTTKYLTRPTASVKKSGTKITVSWKKNASAKGYEVQCATNSSFSKNKKLKTVSKNSTLKTSFTGMKKGRRYYVRVRSYNLVNGKKVYSAWSKYKSIYL